MRQLEIQALICTIPLFFALRCSSMSPHGCTNFTICDPAFDTCCPDQQQASAKSQKRCQESVSAKSSQTWPAAIFSQPVISDAPANHLMSADSKLTFIK